MLWRIGLFYCAAPLSGAFGGLLATGLAQIQTGGYNGWPFIFFVEGAITVIFGLIAVCFLPNTPSDSKFLTPELREAAVQRMHDDSQGSTSNTEVEKEKFDWHWVKLAIFDVNTILLSMIFFFIITPIYSFSLFLPTINSTFGYSRVVAQLLTVSASPIDLRRTSTEQNADSTIGPSKHRRILQRPRDILAFRPFQTPWNLHARRLFSHADWIHNAHLHTQKSRSIWWNILREFPPLSPLHLPNLAVQSLTHPPHHAGRSRNLPLQSPSNGLAIEQPLTPLRPRHRNRFPNHDRKLRGVHRYFHVHFRRVCLSPFSILHSTSSYSLTTP